MVVELLNAGVEQFAHAADERIVRDEAIELMSVNGEVTFAQVFPRVPLIHGNAHEMGHHFRKTVVVISLDPDDLNAALAVGQLTNLGQEEPMITVQTREVQV